MATKNKGKIREIGSMLEGLPIEVLSLDDFSSVPEVTEDGETFLENALKKAETISRLTGEVALADDSGLMVDFLGGRPGIYSSRYAGDAANDESNIEKLLKDLEGVSREKRGASFVCVLVLFFPDGHYESFEGRWVGRIYDKPEGKGGFGYDPVFYLPDREQTVAGLSPEVKNDISHRARAFEKLRQFLLGNPQILGDIDVRGDII